MRASRRRYVSPEYYYSIPERPIYKSYPVYAPDREPPGYFERLQGFEPEIAFDVTALKTKEDWIRAGELVFDAPIGYGMISSLEELRDPNWYRNTGALLAGDGTLPNVRYVIRQKGKVEIGDVACAHCHSRVMPDGSVLKGAQGNSAFEQAWAYSVRTKRVPLLPRDSSTGFCSTPPGRAPKRTHHPGTRCPPTRSPRGTPQCRPASWAAREPGSIIRLASRTDRHREASLPRRHRASAPSLDR